MRILHVIPALAPGYGGPSRTAPDLAQALVRADPGNINVDVVTTNADGSGVLAEIPTGQWLDLRFPPTADLALAGSVCRVRYFTRVGRREYKLSLALGTWLLFNIGRYDLVHGMALFNFPVLAATTVCRLRGVPYLVQPHGMLDPWAMAHKAGRKRPYFNLFERPALNNAGAIHCLTPNEARAVAALGVHTPAAVVANGIHPEEATQPLDPEPFLQRFEELRGAIRLLFLHRVDPKKGLDILAPALAAVRARFPRVRLVVAGPTAPGYAETARELFARAGVADAVTWTGLLSGDFKRSALAAADIFVTPTYSEGFSMSVLEALAAGVPNLMTTGCNFPEAAAANAAREVPIDASAFACALGELLADPETARAMGQRGREFVLDRYTWAHAASNTLDVYRAILDGRPIPHTVPGAIATPAAA